MGLGRSLKRKVQEETLAKSALVKKREKKKAVELELEGILYFKASSRDWKAHGM